MDTRRKIVDFDTAVRIVHSENPRVLVGRFDPLIAEHARRLDEVAGGEPLLAVVLDYPGCLLAAAARAELVAALRSVRYVSVLESANLDASLRRFDRTDIVREDEADEARQKQLVERLREIADPRR